MSMHQNTYTQTYSRNPPDSNRAAGLALKCVQSYNLIIINQYANQGAAFMSNPRQADETHALSLTLSHTHTFTPQTTVWLQGIWSPARVTSKISIGAKSHQATTAASLLTAIRKPAPAHPLNSLSVSEPQLAVDTSTHAKQTSPHAALSCFISSY